MPQLGGAVWLGLRMSALVVLAAALGAAVLLALAGAPVFVSGAVLLAAVLVAAVPVGQRPLLQWLAPASRYSAARLARGHRWHDTGRTEPGNSIEGRHGRRCRLPLPPECDPVVLLEVDGIAALTTRTRRDRQGTLTTVVLEIAGADRFTLHPPNTQDTHLGTWGSCLDALSSDPDITRIQWLTHTRPDTRDPMPLRDILASDAFTDALNQGNGAPAWALLQDQQHLAAAARAAAWQHRHLLTVTYRAGVHSTDDEARASQLERVRSLAGLLLTADLLATPLNAAELGRLLWLLTDPTLPDRTSPDRTLPDHATSPGTEKGGWGLSSRAASWTSVRTDDSWHRSYALTGWPRLPLPAEWLSPLLHTPLPTGTARTLALHATPVAPLRAARQARAAAAKAELDAADRSRLGLTPSSAFGLTSDAVALEAELAAGYRLLATAAVLTVTAPDQARLDAACTALRTAAATSRLDLRPLHGQHPLGLVATLPLGQHPGARP
jgi:hypothetical protein